MGLKTWDNVLGNEINAYQTLIDIGCSFDSDFSTIQNQMKKCAEELGYYDESDDYSRLARELLNDAQREFNRQ